MVKEEKVQVGSESGGLLAAFTFLHTNNAHRRPGVLTESVCVFV